MHPIATLQLPQLSSPLHNRENTANPVLRLAAAQVSRIAASMLDVSATNSRRSRLSGNESSEWSSASASYEKSAVALPPAPDVARAAMRALFTSPSLLDSEDARKLLAATSADPGPAPARADVVEGMQARQLALLSWLNDATAAVPPPVQPPQPPAPTALHGIWAGVADSSASWKPSLLGLPRSAVPVRPLTAFAQTALESSTAPIMDPPQRRVLSPGVALALRPEFSAEVRALVHAEVTAVVAAVLPAAAAKKPSGAKLAVAGESSSSALAAYREVASGTTPVESSSASDIRSVSVAAAAPLASAFPAPTETNDSAVHHAGDGHLLRPSELVRQVRAARAASAAAAAAHAPMPGAQVPVAAVDPSAGVVASALVQSAFASQGASKPSSFAVSVLRPDVAPIRGRPLQKHARRASSTELDAAAPPLQQPPRLPSPPAPPAAGAATPAPAVFTTSGFELSQRVLRLLSRWVAAYRRAHLSAEQLRRIAGQRAHEREQRARSRSRSRSLSFGPTPMPQVVRARRSVAVGTSSGGSSSDSGGSSSGSSGGGGDGSGGGSTSGDSGRSSRSERDLQLLQPSPDSQSAMHASSYSGGGGGSNGSGGDDGNIAATTITSLEHKAIALTLPSETARPPQRAVESFAALQLSPPLLPLAHVVVASPRSARRLRAMPHANASTAATTPQPPLQTPMLFSPPPPPPTTPTQSPAPPPPPTTPTQSPAPPPPPMTPTQSPAPPPPPSHSQSPATDGKGSAGDCACEAPIADRAPSPAGGVSSHSTLSAGTTRSAPGVTPSTGLHSQAQASDEAAPADPPQQQASTLADLTLPASSPSAAPRGEDEVANLARVLAFAAQGQSAGDAVVTFTPALWGASATYAAATAAAAAVEDVEHAPPSAGAANAHADSLLFSVAPAPIACAIGGYTTHVARMAAAAASRADAAREETEMRLGRARQALAVRQPLSAFASFFPPALAPPLPPAHAQAPSTAASTASRHSVRATSRSGGTTRRGAASHSAARGSSVVAASAPVSRESTSTSRGGGTRRQLRLSSTGRSATEATLAGRSARTVSGSGASSAEKGSASGYFLSTSAWMDVDRPARSLTPMARHSPPSQVQMPLPPPPPPPPPLTLPAGMTPERKQALGLVSSDKAARARAAAAAATAAAAASFAAGSSDSEDDDDDERERHWQESLGAAARGEYSAAAAAAREELRRLPVRLEQRVLPAGINAGM